MVKTDEAEANEEATNSNKAHSRGFFIRMSHARFPWLCTVLGVLGGVVFAANLFKVDSGLGVFHVQRFQLLDDDARNGQIAEPFVVGWNDEPWRVLCAASGESVFVPGHVVLPEGALPVIGFADLPVLGGVVEALLKALQLFFF